MTDAETTDKILTFMEIATIDPVVHIVQDEGWVTFSEEIIRKGVWMYTLKSLSNRGTATLLYQAIRTSFPGFPFTEDQMGVAMAQKGSDILAGDDAELSDIKKVADVVGDNTIKVLTSLMSRLTGDLSAIPKDQTDPKNLPN